MEENYKKKFEPIYDKSDFLYLVFWIIFAYFIWKPSYFNFFLVAIAYCAYGYTLISREYPLKLNGTRLRFVPVIGGILGLLNFIIFDKPLGYGFITKGNEKYGLVWTVAPFPFHIFGERMIVISDPKCAEYILKTNFSNYVKGPIFYHRFVELFGDGIFNADGSLWKSQRQVASHLFKVSNLKDMMKVFIEHTHKFSSILQSFADSKQVIDVQDYFSRLTMDSIGKIAFGCELDSLSKTNVPFANAFDQSQVAVAERFLNPFWNISFFRRFMYTEKEFQHSLKVMNEFAYDIIQQRRKDPNLASKTDLLSQYLQMTNEDGKPFSDQYLRDILLNYMIAGRDTTAITTTFVIYLLAQNPHVEKKLLEEIASKIGMDHEPDYDILKDMPYLTAVIDETLRLYPPVSYDPKHSLNDDVLPNGMKVPKGSQVAWTAYGMGRSSLFFPDPLKFKPERFLDPAENGGRKIEPGDLIPFQAGPRICLGKPMAYLEVKTVVIMLLQRWKFQCANDKPVILVPSVTLYAKGGILMNVEKRN